MLKLHVVQAEQGDCSILQADAGCFILIDGGPRNNGARHLGPALRTLGVPRLELAILSHVDNDHVLGLLEFFTDVRARTLAGEPWDIAALWHNSFSETVGEENARRIACVAGQDAARGFREGGELMELARDLKIPVNPGFRGRLVAMDSQSAVPLCERLKVRVLAPDVSALQRLRAKWEQWLRKAEKQVARGRKPSLDSSPTNRSSIVVYAECGGRTALLTGDARGDDIQKGLVKSGLSRNGRIHVNLLKVQHHGSSRNASREFFATVTADTYVVSANGNDRNPDYGCLVWLVDAAHEQGRRIELFVTNATEAVLKLATERPPEDFGYDLEIMERGEDVRSIDV